MNIRPNSHFRFSVQDDGSVIVIEEGKSRTFDGGWPVAAMLRQLIAERSVLRVRLAAIESAPTVAVVCSSESFGTFVQQRLFGSQLPGIGAELIARTAGQDAA